MRVLTISADRSKRGALFPGTPAFKRQEAYAKQFGDLDIIGFSRKSDGAQSIDAGTLHAHPTNSSSRSLYWLDALRIAKKLPRPDVVSVQDPFETGLVGWWIARRFKVPLHVQVHTDFLSPQYARLSMLNRIRVLIAGFVLRRARCVRVVSQRIKQSIAQRYVLSSPITVLPIFADLQRFVSRTVLDADERFSSFRHRLLVVARLEPEKNVACAIRAFSCAAPNDACLVIVGDGSERGMLELLVRRHRLSSRVFFENPRDIEPYYKLADIILVPSKYEGYGLVIIEALAAGKPVLSTDVGIAREAGAIVTTEDKFADALAEWFKSGPRTAELKNYPYRNFDKYVRAYCDDIIACANGK